MQYNFIYIVKFQKEKKMMNDHQFEANLSIGFGGLRFPKIKSLTTNYVSMKLK